MGMPVIGVSRPADLCIATINCFFVTNLLKMRQLAAGHLRERVVFGR
jgi:hypothetical protein